MKMLNIPISDEVLFTLKKDEIHLQEEARKIIAIEFFKNKRLSLGKAAGLAGMSKNAFTILLGENNLDIYRYDDGEFEAELEFINSFGGMK